MIALGGGSPIDLAKAVALLTSHGGKLTDYNVKTGGSAAIGKVSPQIAIPTAAGNGADAAHADLADAMEVTDGIVLHDWMTDFVAGIGLPTILSALNVDAALLPQIAEKAAVDHLSATNPRPAGAEDYLHLLRAAM